MSSVDHPNHYNNHPSGVECIDVVEHFNFNLGNAIKYIWRAGIKGVTRSSSKGHTQKVTIEDLEKARWYLDREIERIKRA
jgi:hypothetical protein